jgi:hypothetical protein
LGELVQSAGSSWEGDAGCAWGEWSTEAIYLSALSSDIALKELPKSLTWNCALANELDHGSALSSRGSTENLGRKHLDGILGKKNW